MIDQNPTRFMAFFDEFSGAGKSSCLTHRFSGDLQKGPEYSLGFQTESLSIIESNSSSIVLPGFVINT
jgi:hypothetical protein